MACNLVVIRPPYYRHQGALRRSASDASGCRDSSLKNDCLSFRLTVFHTENPYGSLSDQISKIIEVLVSEGTSPHSDAEPYIEYTFSRPLVLPYLLTNLSVNLQSF